MSQDDPQQRPSPGQPPGQPHLTERAQREAEERRARQARALRANLARRKAQDRARMDDDAAGDKPAGALENKD
ncbi:MAG: hypothetical protein JNM30_00625 [Rhodospirillales bacterium]|nr:hypothetical protein [Rhodospirillales bacterium]